MPQAAVAEVVQMTEMTVEAWRGVHYAPDFYAVSNLGRVKSLDRTIEKTSINGKKFKSRQTGKMLKLWGDSNGYATIYICDGESQRAFNVHRLVALAFLGVIPGKNDVNHIDGDKNNNRLVNLEWCTRIENMAHARSIGLVEASRKVVATPKADAAGQKRIYASTKEAAELMGGGQKASNIRSALVGTIPSAYGFTWKYA
jgi:hypothetical protein